MFKNIPAIFQLVKSDLGSLFHRNTYLKNNSLSDKDLSCLNNLRKKGFCIIENYINKDKCEQIKNKFYELSKTKKDQNFESGAYIRFNLEKTKKDQGVCRIYHIDKELPELLEFKNDKKIHQLASAYYGTPMYSSFIALQHNFLSKGDTREYHIDSWQKEFKAFVYLEDVDINNGPFAYLAGSNNAYLTRYKKLLFNSDNTSFYEKDLGSWINNEEPITGKAGTLILADVSGFHRGLPQLTKSRTILYNNIYSLNIEQNPQFS